MKIGKHLSKEIQHDLNFYNQSFVDIELSMQMGLLKLLKEVSSPYTFRHFPTKSPKYLSLLASVASEVERFGPHSVISDLSLGNVFQKVNESFSNILPLH